jgi:hypothetical protein
MPRILNVKPVNLPDTPIPTTSTSKNVGIDMDMSVERKIGGTVLIPSSRLAQGPASSSPEGEGVGRLMKYRFTGKVDTRQLSSPQL